MTVETFLTKRRSLYRNEVGLFPTNPMAEEDLAAFASNAEIMAKLWTEKRIQRLRYLWGLVHKVADNTNLFIDKDEAMEGLKIAAGFSKAVYNTATKEIETKPKSLTRISDEQLRLLTDRIQAVIVTQILPGISATVLRKEIETIIGTPTYFDPP